MAGLNISDVLSSVSGTKTPSGSNNVSSLFSSMNANNKSSNLTSDILGINYSDYSSIKSGSYAKLMKKYYSNDSVSNDKDGIEAYKKNLDTTASKASTLASTINDLMDASYTDENKDELVSGIEKFVKQYNGLVSNVKDSSSAAILKQAAWMTNMVQKYTNSLSNIGIDVNSDNTLSINKEALSNAKMSSIKDVFGMDPQSFSNKVLYKSEQIYSLAKTYGSSATAYTSNGTYNRDYSSSYETNV